VRICLRHRSGGAGGGSAFMHRLMLRRRAHGRLRPRLPGGARSHRGAANLAPPPACLL